jgi:hypothetical protein
MFRATAPRRVLSALLCVAAALSCASEQQDPASSPAAESPAPLPVDTPNVPGAGTPRDTAGSTGPMIHPRRDPPGAEPGDSAGSLQEDATTDPAGAATWTIGVTSVPAGVDVPPLPVLTSLRTGTHAEYVRMTVEIGPDAPGPPGYKVEYIDRPLIECGSGAQIFPVGDAWLELRLEPAAAHTEDGQPTLGPREIAVEGPLLLRLYRTCNFEGVVTLVMALASPNPYRVLTLPDPWRIVVDVQR